MNYELINYIRFAPPLFLNPCSLPRFAPILRFTFLIQKSFSLLVFHLISYELPTPNSKLEQLWTVDG